MTDDDQYIDPDDICAIIEAETDQRLAAIDHLFGRLHAVRGDAFFERLERLGKRPTVTWDEDLGAVLHAEGLQYAVTVDDLLVCACEVGGRVHWVALDRHNTFIEGTGPAGQPEAN